MQASAQYISLFYLLLLHLLFSFRHSVAHDISNIKRDIPDTNSTSVTPHLRAEGSRIAVPFGDRRANYEIVLLSNRTHSEKSIAKRQSIWYGEAFLSH